MADTIAATVASNQCRYRNVNSDALVCYFMEKLMVPLLIILQFLVAVNSQYLVLPQFKPDLSFGEHNDRFDLSSFIRHQDRILKEDAITRRSNRDNLKRKGRWFVLDAKGQQDVLDSIKNTIAGELDEIGELASNLRRSNRDIYPVDIEPKDDKNFEMSIDELGARRSLNDVFIKLGGGRRKGMKETHLDYAIPIEMTVDGYLVLPDVV